VWEYYGASEGGGTVISPQEWLRKPGSVGKPFPGHRFLVLDDDVSVLEAMRSLLERWGCEVIAASSPEEAEASLASAPGPIDMLIVDYRLRRNASGIETVERLHQLAGTRIPALVITGDTAPDRLREAQESGYPLLHKPVKSAQLRAAMQRLSVRTPPPQGA